MDRAGLKAVAPLVYLHGLPGGPDELKLVSGMEEAFAPDLRDGPVAEQIIARFGTTPITLIGFSLGAFAAMRFAADQPSQVAHLHLIAPAAPLELGDFLKVMAGGPIFRMARDHPWLFRLVTRVQGLVARIAPDFFARQVFALSQGKDAPLAADPAFRNDWSALAQKCLSGGAAAYRAEITAYVGPWSDVLARVGVPTTLWYGTADNWVPPAMAEALAQALPNVACVRQIMDGSHYSTLAAALPHITAPSVDQSAFS
jgi:pimeloyl-ACP methyl ester carboxylesterase